MRSRRKTRLRYVGAALVAFFMVVIGGLSILPDQGAEANGNLAPTALNQIARRNDLAAAQAAADLRAKSEASARAADSLSDAEDRARERAEGSANSAERAR